MMETEERLKNLEQKYYELKNGQSKTSNKLQALSINEEVGDIPTHFFKSGSSMRPKERLTGIK